MKRITISPAEQRVVVLPDKPEEKIGMVYIPKSVERETPRIGTIISTGTGSSDNPMMYYTGQKVIFSKYSGIEVELNLDGELKNYLVMNQIDIMMIIREVD